MTGATYNDHLRLRRLIRRALPPGKGIARCKEIERIPTFTFIAHVEEEKSEKILILSTRARRLLRRLRWSGEAGG
jgi:hypothetical protein